MVSLLIMFTIVSAMPGMTDLDLTGVLCVGQLPGTGWNPSEADKAITEKLHLPPLLERLCLSESQLPFTHRHRQVWLPGMLKKLEHLRHLDLSITHLVTHDLETMASSLHDLVSLDIRGELSTCDISRHTDVKLSDL